MTHLDLPDAPANGCQRLLLVGDIVGKPGMRIACQSVPWLRSQLKVDALIVNAENAADGSGLRCKDFRRLIDAGVDAVTLGDHAFRKREIMEVLESDAPIVRPANFPEESPGRGSVTIQTTRGHSVSIVSLLGRVFMRPVDCPFHAADRVLDDLPASTIRLVDFHAEATSDMQLMGRHLDGRVSAVLGTHTHVATADQQILPGGTGFQCDVGMTGPFSSILGRKVDAVLEATLHGVPEPFQVASDDVRLNATWLDVDEVDGRCQQIGRIDVRESTITSYNDSAEAARKVL